MEAITTIWKGEKLRDYSHQLRRYSEELVDAAKEARRRAKIAVERSRARNGHIAATGQLERETVTY